MTREAVTEGFEEFISEAIAETMEEFSVSRALKRGINGPGSRVVDQLLTQAPTIQREVVQPELQSYREQTFDQFDVILDYADTAGRNFVNLLATPGWRDCLNAYVR